VHPFFATRMEQLAARQDAACAWRSGHQLLAFLMCVRLLASVEGGGLAAAVPPNLPAPYAVRVNKSRRNSAETNKGAGRRSFTFEAIEGRFISLEPEGSR
jgi:hypothetical protein